jgi:flagellar motor protein MotB
MTREDSRAQRFAKTWCGRLLAGLVGIGSAIELAAMPLPATEAAQLPGPILIQQSTEPDAAGTPRLPSGDESKPDSFIELHEALTAARGRLEELSRAAEAVAATRQLRQELAVLRQENQQLRAEIDAVWAERGELETAKQAAEARAAELTKTVEQATAQAREMDQQLLAVAARWQDTQLNSSLAQARPSDDQMEASEQQRIAVADSARTDAEVRLSEMRASLQRTEEEKAGIGAELARLRGELARAGEQVAAAGQERVQNGQQAAALEKERDELRARLADVTVRLGRSEAANAQLESEVAELRGATNTATDVAREDLRATPTLPSDGEGAHLDQRGILGGVPAVLTLADLPREKRLRVQGLVADLHSKLDERGLMTTVPGERLFAVGSDGAQAAYATLVKVAELIRLYDNRQVLIIGHSDADGDAAYNKQLSERRAELLKQILVENFHLAADRLSTEGAGETRPIASNATPQGRRANRRVEVLILN